MQSLLLNFCILINLSLTFTTSNAISVRYLNNLCAHILCVFFSSFRVVLDSKNVNIRICNETEVMVTYCLVLVVFKLMAFWRMECLKRFGKHSDFNNSNELNWCDRSVSNVKDPIRKLHKVKRIKYCKLPIARIIFICKYP